MVGYPETLTDPSYGGQILALTSPLVGNYGVPDPSETDDNGISRWFESDKIQVRGMAIHELSEAANHWKISMTLDEWLYDEKIPGISGIDTRQLTKQLRSEGVRMGALAVSSEPIDSDELSGMLPRAKSYDAEHHVDSVSASDMRRYGKGNPVVVVVDTGSKNAIIRNICRMGYDVIRVPWNTSADKILSYDPHGVVISNGPGDPQHCPETIRTADALIKNGTPMLGICLGAQIIGLAGGAGTYKLKYGHRGQNKPCIDLSTNQVYVTSQNHGYCIDPDSLPGSEFEKWFVNADDKTVEGIRHRQKPVIAVQFHPEASPGPYDCMFVFERLKQLMEERDPAKK